MSWRKWKIGCAVSFALSALVGGAGLAAGGSWTVFIATFCAAGVTHFGAFITNHPVEKIEFDEDNQTIKP